MKYMGSKDRIANDILPIILQGRKTDQWYVEPFCGGCNVIDKVKGNRIASDVNPYLIAFADALSNGWLPPKNITEDEYRKIKDNIDQYEPRLVGYVGFQLSYGSMWFHGYRKDTVGKRNYSLEAYNHIVNQAENLKGIKFLNLSYSDLIIPSNSIIYCDPPYQNTVDYKANKEDFDHDKFWQWCRDKSKEGHRVFISEYNAPDDFEWVWKGDISNYLVKERTDVTEHLFTYKYGPKAVCELFS